MNYRSFGKLDYKPSALGFGCMRLPYVGGDTAQIDEPEAIRMIRRAIDSGVNYVDSAYVYHRGRSEVVLGKALQDGYRDKVKLATKLPMFMMKEASESEKIFQEQLERLQTDHIDFYLLHALNTTQWAKVKDLGVIQWAEKKLAEGSIKYLGFSFHDAYDVFKEIVDAYPWTFCQIQYNYFDINYQAGIKGLRYAASKGLGVVIMEPVRGGALARVPSPSIQALWESAKVRRTPAEWALQWVWNQPEVSLLLSGMSNMKQVEENLASACRSGAGTLTEEESVLINKVAREYRAAMPVTCTSCKYCVPCPQGIDIPEIFSMYNEAVGFGHDAEGMAPYIAAYGRIKPENRADACARCGNCEQKCPQRLPIRDILPKAHAALSGATSK